MCNLQSLVLRFCFMHMETLLSRLSKGREMELKKLSISLVVVLVLVLVLQILSAVDFDPYRILGVSRTSNQADIKKAYKKLAREW